MLLIVTNKSDLACDFLIVRLNERGIPFLRLNTEDLGKAFHIDLFLSGKRVYYELRLSGGRVVKATDISAVYFRQPVSPDASSDTLEEDRAFVRRELQELMRSLWRLIEPEIWLNHPKNLWLASNKVEQLKVARSLGFTIPDTCVSACESTVREFAQTRGQLVGKAVKHGFFHQDNQVRVAPTQRLAPDFATRLREYAHAPMILQDEIQKDYDIRATVVGDSVFAAAIYSQEHLQTEVDWRVWDFEHLDLRHEVIELPSHIELLCRRITAYFGLRYSAIDLVRDRHGEHYFLEMNPNGQWAWIEQTTGHPIRDALIDSLGVRCAS